MAKKIIFYTVFMVCFLGFGFQDLIKAEEGRQMKIKSNDFEHNKMMDAKFTCQGDDISPQLVFENIPQATKSLALSVIDPDAPGGDFIHWLVYNIPADTKEIPQGGPLPQGSIEVINDFGKREYGGPCPPWGTHRYFFTLYALDTDALQGLTKASFVGEVKKHAIETAEIIGLYRKK
jgi:hypothetical protein